MRFARKRLRGGEELIEGWVAISLDVLKMMYRY